jgi:hypothetical protein
MIVIPPHEMIHKFTDHYGRCRGWTVLFQPDGSDSFGQALQVHRTKRAALDQATRFYCAWTAQRGLPWDTQIDPYYRDVYDCFVRLAEEPIELIVAG